MNKTVTYLVFKRIFLELSTLLLILAMIIALTGIPSDIGIVQYETGIEELIKLNFERVLNGEIFTTEIKSERISSILLVSAKRSSIILGFGMLLALCFGVIKGVIDARKKNRIGTIKLLQSLIPLSLPDILMITLVQLGALYLFKNEIAIPGLGIVPYIGDESIANAFFPVLAISILPGAYISRTVANIIEDGLTQPFILAARGKGCSMFQLITTHLWKRILFGVLSALPTVMGIMFSSLLIVETFFMYRGIGYHLIYFYTTTLIPKVEAGYAFTVFLLALAVFYFIMFTGLNMLKQIILPRIKSY